MRYFIVIICIWIGCYNICFSQLSSSFKYISYEDILPSINYNEDAIEFDNHYYIITDFYKDTIGGRISYVTVFDEYLNLINEKKLIDTPNHRLFKLVKTESGFAGFGLIKTPNNSKPFFIKFDKNLNSTQPMTLYWTDDTLKYIHCNVFVNQSGNFMLLNTNGAAKSTLLVIDNDGNILQEAIYPVYNFKANIAESYSHYFINFGSKYIAKVDKHNLSIVDSFSFNNITNHSITASGNILSLNDSTFALSYSSGAIHEDCFSEKPDYSSEQDIFVLITDTNLNIKKNIQLGINCYRDVIIRCDMDFFNPNSIYIAFETYLKEEYVYPFLTSGISFANFDYSGNIFTNMLADVPQDDNSNRTIHGIRALSDGGCLIFGNSEDIQYSGDTAYSSITGFLIKYHPEKELIIKEYPFEINRKVYPNPAQKEFTVTNTENSVLQLYNILGQEVVYQNNTQENTTVQIGHLPSGVYILKVMKNNKLSTHKIQIIK